MLLYRLIVFSLSLCTIGVMALCMYQFIVNFSIANSGYALPIGVALVATVTGIKKAFKK